MSPIKNRLHGKIGNVDAEQIEKAIDRIKQSVIALQEECKKKGDRLKALTNDSEKNSGLSPTSSRTIATRNHLKIDPEINSGDG